MSHTCHWPGCKREVPPKMWGCRAHWFTLPADLRAAVWREYRPGQEIRKDPSEAYLAVADEVHRWCLDYDRKYLPKTRSNEPEPPRTLGLFDN